MPRLPVKLSEAMHKRLASMAIERQDSMSNTAALLIHMGVKSLESNGSQNITPVDAHCHQLMIQTNALVKSMSSKLLELTKEDFEELRKATKSKYQEILTLNGND